MRLKVKIKNSKDCRVSINFPDLSVKYSNGFSPALKVNEGDEIPLDVLDPEDVRKSLKVGSLRGYLDNGWVEEIQDSPKPVELPVVSPNFDEAKLLQVKAELLTQTIPPQDPLPQLVLQKESAVEQPVSLSQKGPITDLNLVKSYDDFCKLSHFLKLTFIKENGNLDLLREISNKTPSSQFKNNIQLRLSHIKL